MNKPINVDVRLVAIMLITALVLWALGVV